MSQWGITAFGDPCRGCGFDWSISQSDADTLVASAPRLFAELLGDTDGTQTHPDLAWTARGYVCHVGDSLRIWAERLANAALGDAGPVAEYDQDRLSESRCYADVGIRGALWSLGRGVGDWQAALSLVDDRPDTVVVHRELGALTVSDVVRIRAHDVMHHANDVRRIVGWS